MILADEPDRQGSGHVRFPCRVDPVEKLVEPLTGELREHLPYVAPNIVALACHRDVGIVDVLEDVTGLSQHGDEPGHLLEQSALTLTFGRGLAVG